MGEIMDVITIRRVANGWVVQPGRGADEFTHVYVMPVGLAEHIQRWAEAQLPETPKK